MTYPCPQELRRSLLDHLHNRLESTPSIRIDPLAAKLHATRFLTPDLNGAELVDALKQANEDLIAAVKLSLTTASPKSLTKADELGNVYVTFVEDWVSKDIDANLVSRISVDLISFILKHIL